MNVECVGQDYSSSGFSANGSLNVSWISCRAHNFKYIGFTNWGCRNLTYSDCMAWSNDSYAGFNCENGRNVHYSNCLSGGKTTAYATVFMNADSSIGNFHGFVVGGAGLNGLITFSNCMAKYNTSNGIEADGDNHVSVIGGEYSSNGGYGLAFHDTSRTTIYKIESKPTLDSNTTAAILWRGVSETNYPANGAFFLGPADPATDLTGQVLTAIDQYGVGTWQTNPPSKTYTLASGDGWYRFVTQAAYLSGRIRIYGIGDNNIYTDMVIYVTQSGYSASGGINVIENLNYNDNHIDSLRSGYLSDNAVFDIKFKSLLTPTTVKLSALDNIALSASATFNPTAPTVGPSIPGYMMGSYVSNVFPFRNGVSPSLVINGSAADSTLTVFGGGRFTRGLKVGTMIGSGGATADSSVTGTGGHFTRGLVVGTTTTSDSIKVRQIKIDSTLVGSTSLRGSAAFTTTATRLAIYLPGTTTSHFFVASPSGADAAPSANDVLRVYAKTDSLIVNRLASGTSGLVINYIRIQ
jgi:hypothetical protein